MKICGFRIFHTFKNHLTIGFSRKNQFKRIGTAAVLNKAKSRDQLFQSIMNFENFENHLDFVCQPDSLPYKTQ